jgi:antitoxin HigA-1
MPTERKAPQRKRPTSDAMAFLEKLSGGPLTLAKLLRSIREGEAKTQTEFAETLGISKQHLSHIENGRKAVSPERAARWALLLGYSEPQFLRLALQDELRRAGLRYTVTVGDAPRGITPSHGRASSSR